MAQLSQDHIRHLYETYGELKVLDDIICYRAADEPPQPMLGYPRFENSVSEYEHFTGRQLDQFVDAVVKQLLASDFRPNTHEVVGLLASSNPDFIVHWFTLSRLGYTVLCLSLRIPPPAIMNLLQKTSCLTLIHGSSPLITSKLQKVNTELHITTFPIITRKDYDLPPSDEPLFKPESLVDVLEVVKPGAVNSVPYVLGLIAEKPRGVEMLKKCQIVTAAGARTPDELGDRLVQEGINLGVVFGTTEAGLLGDTMRREPGDNSWNYVRIYANLQPFIHMAPLPTAGLYEVVYLPGHPALLTSNSDDPVPGCWHSADVFMPHPTIPDCWKYVTRLDDRVTLVNGEKVLPLPIEGRIRAEALVRECVIVGVDRAIPGLLVFRAKEADNLSDENYINKIWPVIKDANSKAEAFSQITREMVTVLPSNVECPCTDKGNVIRGQVYSKFKDMIDAMYMKLDGSGVASRQTNGVANGVQTKEEDGKVGLSLQKLETWILETFNDTIGVELESAETDFFSAGVDSLKVIQMRREIVKKLELDGHQLGNNIVYEYGNAKELAKFLYKLVEGEWQNGVQEEGTGSVKGMIERYSEFVKPRVVENRVKGLFKHANDLTNGDSSDSESSASAATQTQGFIDGYSTGYNSGFAFGLAKSSAIPNNRITAGYEGRDAKAYINAFAEGYSLGYNSAFTHGSGISSGSGANSPVNGAINGKVERPISQAAIITGTTGSIGAHVLAQAVARSDIEKVYCPVRGAKPTQRVLNSLKERGLNLSQSNLAKVVAFNADLSRPDFGLDEPTFSQMRDEVSLVVHIAWPVNFNISLASFEPHIAGLHNLLNFSSSVRRPKPAQFFFCSSISTAWNMPASSIPEGPIEDFSYTSSTGYGQSKLAAEHIVGNAARRGAYAYVL